MLFPKERGGWERSLAGADMNFVARELELKGVAVEGKKILGVVSCAGWKPAWHDLVLDMNFTIVAGEFQLYTRYWPDKRSYMLEFGPKQGYELNKPYQITIKIKGSKFEMMQPDQPPQMDLMKENTSRTGGVGFAVPPGTKVILSSCKVKVLRPK
jgi:hypothetical protein